MTHYDALCLVDPTTVVDPVIIDDSCLMIDDAALMVCEPIDIRVQFVSSETEPGWAAYYYTVGADGLLQGVSVVASYDEPTIAAFVAEHADDPTVQISDYGDGWWIGGFPLELAPPVPEYGVFSSGDDAVAYGSTNDGTVDNWDGGDAIGGWSWDDISGTYTWSDGTAGGGDWTSTWDDSAVFATGDWSWNDASWNDWAGVDSSVTPLFYARGAVASESFVASAATADAEPVSGSPRSAAFADMSMMAAVASMPQGVVQAGTFGGSRRRR